MTVRTQPALTGPGSLPAADPVADPVIPASSRTTRTSKQESDMHHIPEQMARSHLVSRQAEAEASRVRRVALAARRAAAAERRARLAREAAVLASHQAAVAAAR